MSDNKNNARPKRRHVRFKPDPLDYALIDATLTDDKFTPSQVALIVEEAPMGGCGLVLLDIPALQSGTRCRVQVGRLAPLLAEVVWRKPIDAEIIRIGLRFLE
jgi:hypothetical protein